MESISTKFTQLLSLGRSCTCTHQLRRFTGDESASFFDWLGTPHDGLIHTLNDGLSGCFQRVNLALSEDGTTVRDSYNQFSYRHTFSRLPGSRLIDPTKIEAEYDGQSAKRRFLMDRWTEQMRLDRVLFVRHDTMSPMQVEELYRALQVQRSDRQVHLLIIVPDGHQISTNLANVFIESGCPVELPNDLWTGEDEHWNRVLRPYFRSPHPPIPRPAHVTELARHRRRKQGQPHPLILFQTTSVSGLDSLHRLIAIATAMRQLESTVEILFLTDSTLAPELLEQYGIAHLTLPSRATVFRARSWRQWTNDHQRGIARATIEGLLAFKTPALVVYDGIPSLFAYHALAGSHVPAGLIAPTSQHLKEYLQEEDIRKLLQYGVQLLLPYTTAPADVQADVLCVGEIAPRVIRSKFRTDGCVSKATQAILLVVRTNDSDRHHNLLHACLDWIVTQRANGNWLHTTIAYDSRENLQGLLLEGVSLTRLDIEFPARCLTADLVVSSVSYTLLQLMRLSSTNFLTSELEEDHYHPYADEQLAAARKLHNVSVLAPIDESFKHISASQWANFIESRVYFPSIDHCDGAQTAAAFLMRIAAPS